MNNKLTSVYFGHWTEDHHCRNSLLSLHILIHCCIFCSLGLLHANVQATTLFIVKSATKGEVTTLLRFSVRFKILYRVIQRLSQYCWLCKMVYLNIIYVIAIRNYDFFTTGIVP